MQQPLAVVVSLFGEPGVLGERAEQGFLKRRVDLDVGLRDDLVAEPAPAPGLTVAALLPAVAGARLLVSLQDLAAASGGFLGGFELCSQIRY